MTTQGRSRHGGADDRAPPRLTARETTMQLRRLAFAAVTTAVLVSGAHAGEVTTLGAAELDRITAGQLEAVFDDASLIPGESVGGIFGPMVPSPTAVGGQGGGSGVGGGSFDNPLLLAGRLGFNPFFGLALFGDDGDSSAAQASSISSNP
jgi:hypothetical protein